MLLALSLLLSPAQADTVRALSASQSGGASATVHAWTEAAPGAVGAVEVLVSPQPGSPAPAVDTVRLSQVRAQRQVWSAGAVRFDQDASGARLPLRAAVQTRGGTHLVEVELVAGQRSCRVEPLDPPSGLVQAELVLEPDGRQGELRLVVDERARDIVAIELTLGASAQGPVPSQRSLSARLARVEQLWTGDLPLSGAVGAAYQLDAVTLDGAGQPFGTSLTGSTTLAGGPLAVRPPCERGPGVVAMR